jgi:hypothetical protein
MLRIIDVPRIAVIRMVALIVYGSCQYCQLLIRLLNPESVHSNKRIRIIGFKSAPISQIGGGRVVG